MTRIELEEKLKELDNVLEGEKAVIDEQQIEEATPSTEKAIKDCKVYCRS